ncbi:MAG: DNA-binding protein WhiA [Ruminiclostridium sp.]|nr:DNA-binding protein WhiA [Ruminiclostridium sp.]
MSFSYEVKAELCGCEVPDELKKDLCLGMYYGFRSDDRYFSTFDKSVASYVRKMFPKNVLQMQKIKTKKGESFFLSPTDKNVLRANGLTDHAAERASQGNDAQVGIFLRGMFITCGNVYVQKAGYHLEFSPYGNDKCQKLYSIINEHGMNINLSHRGDRQFLYSKDSENISDLLTFIGAMQGAMEIMNIKIIKDVRSNINRSVNCETANIDRTVKASTKQIEDIRLIFDTLGKDKLPDDLIEIAELRLSNPDMSLRDLGNIARISRSGVNHRFERIAKLAEEIRLKRNTEVADA